VDHCACASPYLDCQCREGTPHNHKMKFLNREDTKSPRVWFATNSGFLITVRALACSGMCYYQGFMWKRKSGDGPCGYWGSVLHGPGCHSTKLTLGNTVALVAPFLVVKVMKDENECWRGGYFRSQKQALEAICDVQKLM
jgi:hypothetical protein